jgi:paraquat-inducible protein B
VTPRGNLVLIGGFVLGALVLLVAGAILLGQAKLFDRTDSFAIYFDETVTGLRVGAPVSYRGVEIGQVTSITAILDERTRELSVPVIVELRPDALTLVGGGRPTPATMAALVEKGLRARLQLENLITARLFVALDFYPFQPMPAPRAGGPALPEIPSIPSPIAGISRSVDELTMAAPEMLKQLGEIVAAVRDLLKGETAVALQASLQASAALLATLAEPEGPLQKTLAELPATTAAVRKATASADMLLTRLDRTVAARDEQVGQLLADAARTSAAIRKVTEQAGAVLAQNQAGLRELTNRGVPEIIALVEDANRMVKELHALARDIRQNPAAFLFGGEASQGVKLR